MVGLHFGFSIGPLSISGGFSFTPTLVVGLIGDVCLEQWKLRFGFDVQTGVAARLYISGSISPIAQGFLRLDGRALGLIFQPMMTADAKKATIGGRFDFGIEAISLGVAAGVRQHGVQTSHGLCPLSPLSRAYSCTSVACPASLLWPVKRSFRAPFDRVRAPPLVVAAATSHHQVVRRVRWRLGG